VLEVSGWSEPVLRDFVDVEGKLGADVGVYAVRIGHDWAKLLSETGELDGNGEVDCLCMSDVIGDVMRERSHGKGKFVGVTGIAQQGDDEVSGTDVVGQIREEFLAEGVIAEILNGTASVCIGMCVLELGGAEIRVSREEQRPNGSLPREVDELLVSLDGGRLACSTSEEEKEGRNNLNRDAEVWLAAP
jgi:hypothetical protein